MFNIGILTILILPIQKEDDFQFCVLCQYLPLMFYNFQFRALSPLLLNSLLGILLCVYIINVIFFSCFLFQVIHYWYVTDLIVNLTGLRIAQEINETYFRMSL